MQQVFSRLQRTQFLLYFFQCYFFLPHLSVSLALSQCFFFLKEDVTARLSSSPESWRDMQRDEKKEEAAWEGQKKEKKISPLTHGSVIPG